MAWLTAQGVAFEFIDYKKAGVADDRGDDTRLGDDREALIEELRAERDAAVKAAGEAAQEAEAAAWLEAKRAAEAAGEG